MYEININIYFLQKELSKYILTTYFDDIDVNIRQYHYRRGEIYYFEQAEKRCVRSRFTARERKKERRRGGGG